MALIDLKTKGRTAVAFPGRCSKATSRMTHAMLSVRQGSKRRSECPSSTFFSSTAVSVASGLAIAMAANSWLIADSKGRDKASTGNARVC